MTAWIIAGALYVLGAFMVGAVLDAARRNGRDRNPDRPMLPLWASAAFWPVIVAAVLWMLMLAVWNEHGNTRKDQ